MTPIRGITANLRRIVDGALIAIKCGTFSLPRLLGNTETLHSAGVDLLEAATTAQNAQSEAANSAGGVEY